MAISASAGPVSNILLALVFAIFLKLSYTFIPGFITTEKSFEIAMIFIRFLTIGVFLNITLAVFNLLPVPPLDGSRMLYVFLPPKQYFGVMKYERYISLGIMLLLLIGVLDPVISFVSSKIASAIFLVVGL